MVKIDPESEKNKKNNVHFFYLKFKFFFSGISVGVDNGLGKTDLIVTIAQKLHSDGSRKSLCYQVAQFMVFNISFSPSQNLICLRINNHFPECLIKKKL